MVDEKFTTYRFIRVGGELTNFFPVVTVRFDVDKKTNEIECWWSLCQSEDNFSRKKGKENVDERATRDNPFYLSFNYFPKYSLEKNFRMAIEALVTDDTLYHTTSLYVYKNLITLHEALDEIDYIRSKSNQFCKTLDSADVFDVISDYATNFKYKLGVTYSRLMGWF